MASWRIGIITTHLQCTIRARMGATSLAAYPQLVGCSSGLNACARAGCWQRALHSFHTMRALNAGGGTWGNHGETVMFPADPHETSWNFMVDFGVVCTSSTTVQATSCFPIVMIRAWGFTNSERSVTTWFGRMISYVFPTCPLISYRTYRLAPWCSRFPYGNIIVTVTNWFYSFFDSYCRWW